MSVNGVATGAGGIGYGFDRAARGATEPAVRGPGVVDGSGAARRADRPGVSGALSDAPPPGTDPELWSVLTTEERAYYAKAQSMGPLTYRPGTASSPTAPPVRGGRLDVRV